MRILFVVACMWLAASVAVAQKKGKKNEVPPPATPPVATEVAPPAAAQPRPDSTQISPQMAHYIRKYSTALAWNDYDVAKDALYDLIVENPGNDSLIYDLAVFYYERQKYASSVLVANELLNRNPKSLIALEIIASGYENLGIADRALQAYERLYMVSDNIGSLYKMAYLQFDLKRYKEAATSVDILLANPQCETLKVVFNDAANVAKEYSMKVSVLTLKGLVALEQGNKAEAKKWLDQALAVSPDFVPARQNLARTK